MHYFKTIISLFLSATSIYGGFVPGYQADTSKTLAGDMGLQTFEDGTVGPFNAYGSAYIQYLRNVSEYDAKFNDTCTSGVSCLILVRIDTEPDSMEEIPVDFKYNGKNIPEVIVMDPIKSSYSVYNVETGKLPVEKILQLCLKRGIEKFEQLLSTRVNETKFELRTFSKVYVGAHIFAASSGNSYKKKNYVLTCFVIE